MKVLVINCGSSSLKYQLIDSEREEVLAKGLCERIGIDGSNIAHRPAGKRSRKRRQCLIIQRQSSWLSVSLRTKR